MNRLFVPLLFALVGCSGPGNYPVSGRVTCDGTPVPVGEVVFTPDTGRGNSGPAFLAEIKDGAYLSPPGKGHVGGAYTVRVIGFDGKAPQAAGLVDHRGTPLFAEKTIAVELPRAAAVQDLSVQTGR